MKLLIIKGPMETSVRGATAQLGPRPPLCPSFEITQNYTRARTPLKKGSARPRGCYLHTKQQPLQTSTSSSVFEPAVTEIKQPLHTPWPARPPGLAPLPTTSLLAILIVSTVSKLHLREYEVR